MVKNVSKLRPSWLPGLERPKVQQICRKGYLARVILTLLDWGAVLWACFDEEVGLCMVLSLIT